MHVNSEEEIQNMREAARIAADTLKHAMDRTHVSLYRDYYYFKVGGNDFR